MQGFFSIRTKFLGVMAGLLLVCMFVYLLIAVDVFKTDKTTLIFDLNRSMVSNISVELETEFVGVSDKFRFFALLAIDPSKNLVNENIFGENSDVVFASIYRRDQNLPFRNFTQKKYLETYGLESGFFEKTLHAKRPLPFAEILRNGEFFWNASVEGGTPLIGYGRDVVIENTKGAALEHLTVIGYIKPDKILKAINLVELSEVFVVDQAGNLLIHSNFEWMKEGKNFGSSALYSAAQNAKTNVIVAELKDESGEYLGAVAKTYHDRVYVLAKASKEHAFSAVSKLVSRSLSFALIVITVSLLFAFLLSKSLTEPISILVEGMEQVSTGDLTTRIEVDSKDETQMLATSFNRMINDLKQSRDELQEINRELDKKVKERTVQLEIQNLAVKEAQEALLKTTRLASAGETAGRAAHEVLNPLTGIITRLTVIEKKIQSQIEPQVNLLKDISGSWKDDHNKGGFETLVKNWQQKSEVNPDWNLWQEDLNNLDFIKENFEALLVAIKNDTRFLLDESGRISKIIGSMRKLSSLKSDVRTYSVKSLLINCRNIMADLFTEENIRITETYGVEADEVDLDRDEFIQAITNLMRNSLHAMLKSPNNCPPNHTFALSIATGYEDGRIYIELKDNGTGIQQNYQKMLFEKQFTTKSSDEGTGLGLGISRRFIRAHGGDIVFVSSVPFEETVFKIYLPAKHIQNLVNKGAA